MKQFTCVFAIFFITNIVFAQKHDNIWLFGKDSENGLPFGGTVFDFNESPVEMFSEYRDMNFRQTDASICDKYGNLQFYTNGIYIANSIHEPMENGEGLNPGLFTNDWSSSGLIVPQGALIIPFPDHENEYFLIHTTYEFHDDFGIVAEDFYYSHIDMNLNNGLGSVVAKNQNIIQNNILDTGKITAVKHANGRDWWIIVWKYDSNIYYRFLINSIGIINKGLDTIGVASESGLGQAVFSPDGSRYVRFNSANITNGETIDIYDFDRCNGLLENPIQLTHIDSAYAAGAAISANSRFLYISSFLKVFQYDLWADDIEASKDTVAVWDGFYSNMPPFATTFYLAQLAPNGKIYLSSNNGVKHMHVINQPNLKGDSCDFQQHGIVLPTHNSFSMPNFPNYRLGPLPGSPCDTLSDFYKPTAAYNFDTTMNSLLVDFLDISTNDPTEWQWTFEDNISMTEQHPQHTFSSSGTYEVCLVASNLFGSDTTCQEVTVEVANATEEVENVSDFIFYPNPVQNELTIKSINGSQFDKVEIINAFGKVIYASEYDNQESIQISTNDLPTGIHLVRVFNKGDVISVEKVVFIH